MNLFQYFVILFFGFSVKFYGQTPLKVSDRLASWTFVDNFLDGLETPEVVNWKNWFKKKQCCPIQQTGWKRNNTDNVKIVIGLAELSIHYNPDNASDGGTYFKSGILKSKETFTTGFIKASEEDALLAIKDKFVNDCFESNSNEVILRSLKYTLEFDRTGKNNFLQVQTLSKKNTIAIEPASVGSAVLITKKGLQTLNPN
ncbi:hypothetical protein [Cognatitamlana onchidii]|uniref:hypothetical protein n=1 Tax=Cognatitamlana onchidii TaxID=2562860 RepID=UPI0010A667BD|nr:hypothetical protein [Algibacter onchidii]